MPMSFMAARHPHALRSPGDRRRDHCG